MAFNLEEVDVDGAIREGAEEAFGDTRLSFLKKGAVAGGAALSGGAILTALTGGTALAAGKGTPPVKPFGKGDIGILNYALTLEYLEHNFYDAAAKNNVANGDTTLNHILTTLKTDERNHVNFLKKKLGKSAIPEPKFDFGNTVKEKNLFANTAYVLENTGVHAYLGQAGNIKTPAYLLAAASILTIEARHAGAIAVYLGKPIDVTGSFDKGYTAGQVLTAVNKTKFIKS